MKLKMAPKSIAFFGIQPKLQLPLKVTVIKDLSYFFFGIQHKLQLPLKVTVIKDL